MLLCMFVGTAWAGPTDLPQITTDLSNPIYYTIYNTRSSQPGGFMYYAGDAVGLKDGCTSFTLESKYKFFFTGSHEAMYIHNAATSNKLASVNSWTADGTVWAVAVSPMGGGLAFGPKGGLNGNSCWNEKNFATEANTSDFTTWSANDAGSIFVVELASEYTFPETTFPETDKFYTIECPLFENTQGVKKGLYVNAEGALAWGTVDLTNKNYYWVPTLNTENNTIVLKNVGTGKYLSGTGVADEAANASLNALGSGQFSIFVNNVTVHADGHLSGAGAAGNIVDWQTGANNASAWSFVEQADPDAAIPVTINYSFTYGGVEKYTQSTTTIVGDEYPAITTAFPYGVSAVKPEGVIPNEGIVDGVKTVEIPLTVKLPFVPAADYASIQNWYYIQMHSTGGNYSRYIQAMDDCIEWLDVDMNASEVDSYTWGFIGNPFDGFKLVNYGKGAEMGVNSTGSGNPAMGDIATATAWTLKPSASNPTAEYFCFQYPGSNQYMNAQSDKIAFWGSADEGSTMWVTERDLSGATELQAVIDQVEAFVAAGVTGGTTVGYLTSESVANVATVLAAAKEAVATKTGCITAQAALQAAVAAVETIQPEEGKFYVIASAMPESDGRSGQKMYVNNDGYMHFQAADAFANVFQFVNKEGKFYLLNVQSGAYLNTAKGHNGGQETTLAFDIADAKSVAIANMGRANAVSLIPEGGAMMHAQASASAVVAWNNTDNAGASAWVITEVNIKDFAHTVTVGEVRYSTLVLGYNAVIPANVKAYAVSTVEDGRAKLAEVTGVLAAGEAVVLEAAEGSYDFKYATEAATEVESNLLAGTVFNTNVAANAYVLANGEDGIGLYKATLNKNENGEAGTTHFLNNANKAYLPASDVPAGARFLSFDFGNETAIESVEGAENGANAVIYDLSGRRVQKAQKGLYIVNGVKVIK